MLHNRKMSGGKGSGKGEGEKIEILLALLTKNLPTQTGRRRGFEFKSKRTHRRCFTAETIVGCIGEN